MQFNWKYPETPATQAAEDEWLTWYEDHVEYLEAHLKAWKHKSWGWRKACKNYSIIASAEMVRNAELEAELTLLRGMVGELADIVEDVEFENDVDAPSNDDMNRWLTAAMKDGPR